MSWKIDNILFSDYGVTVGSSQGNSGPLQSWIFHHMIG